MKIDKIIKTSYFDDKEQSFEIIGHEILESVYEKIDYIFINIGFQNGLTGNWYYVLKYKNTYLNDLACRVKDGAKPEIISTYELDKITKSNEGSLLILNTQNIHKYQPSSNSWVRSETTII